MHISGLPSLCTPKAQTREASAGSMMTTNWVQKWKKYRHKIGTSSFFFFVLPTRRSGVWRNSQTWELFYQHKAFWRVGSALPSMLLSPSLPFWFLLIFPHIFLHILLYFLLYFLLFNQHFAEISILQLTGLWVRFLLHLNTEKLRESRRTR